MKYLLPLLCLVIISSGQLLAQPMTPLEKCRASEKLALDELESVRQLAEQRQREIEGLKNKIDQLEFQLRNAGINTTGSTPSPSPAGIPNQIPSYESNPAGTSPVHTGDDLYSLSSRDQENVIKIRNHVDNLIQQGRQDIAMPLKFFGNNEFQCYVVDLKSSELITNFFWQDRTGNSYRNLGNLKSQTQNSGSYGELLFATNGGMFNQRGQPKGLLMIGGRQLQPLDRARNGYGNFYLQPNGVFLLQNDDTPRVVKTEEFDSYRNITKLATQSGPMLVIDGRINPLFDRNSSNKHIRSGVGIINDRYVVFIKTSLPATFYETAVIFKEAFGCDNALFLDGGISKMYSSNQYMRLDELDGFFGTLIGIYRRH